MKVAVMQPYFLPYIGYWQLLHAADVFVIYDRVNYIKGGWINRNRILVNGSPSYITVPVSGASSNAIINELSINSGPNWRRKMLSTIRHSYAKAPAYEARYPLLRAVIEHPADCLTTFLHNGISRIAACLGIDTRLVLFSEAIEQHGLHGKDRILDICRQLGATHYYNLPGGRGMYEPEEFAGQGIELRFIEPGLRPYPQTTAEFIPGLSIADIMMQNDDDNLQAQLLDYALVAE